jgi:hypothetical protein
MSHTYVRQITDRAMSKAMFIETETTSEKRNQSRRNNIERLRWTIEVDAAGALPGTALVVAQEDVETELRAGPLPENVQLAHYNAVAGLNTWSDVRVETVVGRTEPDARKLEATARAVFGVDVVEVPADEKGNVPWPKVARGIRMRDGTGRLVMGSQHPDPRVESVRWQTCEANMVQTIGRARAVNRGPDNPLTINIYANVCLPIVVDETLTWAAAQPSNAEIMRARGAVPVRPRDAAAAHADLFPSEDAAKKALIREAESTNPGQTSIRDYLIDKCPGFAVATYRLDGERKSARLLYDPRRVEPAAWLRERLGDVAVLSAGEPLATEPDADDEPATAPAPAPATRRCGWFTDTSGAVFQKCGEPIVDGRDWCSVHRAQYARTHAPTGLARNWMPPLEASANEIRIAATPGLIPCSRVPLEEMCIAAGIGAWDFMTSWIAGAARERAAGS